MEKAIGMQVILRACESTESTPSILLSPVSATLLLLRVSSTALGIERPCTEAEKEKKHILALVLSRSSSTVYSQNESCRSNHRTPAMLHTCETHPPNSPPLTYIRLLFQSISIPKLAIFFPPCRSSQINKISRLNPRRPLLDGW